MFGPEPRVDHLPSIEAVVDLELTTLCNAHCTFCPRDQTPHLGRIDSVTFEQALRRAVEYRDAIRRLRDRGHRILDTTEDTLWLSFCGMGDAMMHPELVDYVRRVAEVGLRPLLNTNGAKLTPARGEALLDAGLAWVCVNAGEQGDHYEAVYGLPFERTRDNVTAFAERAQGRCKVTVVLVDHRDDPSHRREMARYWRERGVTGLFPMAMVNRAGALELEDHQRAHREFAVAARARLAAMGPVPRCATPLLHPFIGYDGRYYLCSSDWRKEVAVGNVFDHAIVELLAVKRHHVRTRSPICASCSHEPTNAVARALAAAAVVERADGDVAAAEASVDRLVGQYRWEPEVTAVLTSALAPAPSVPVEHPARSVSREG